MAIGREQAFYGQGRVDVPHLRALDSGVQYDIDVLMGAMLCGNKPLVLSGFETVTKGIPGIAATSLQITVANALIAHPLASDAGTILQVPSTRAAEVLNTSNARLVGSFTAGAVNYVGIDLFRTQDATTADIFQFLDETTNQENAQQLPLAATYDYTIYISTQDFSVNPNILPVVKVTTDANNNVSSVEDARNMMWRLGGGGSLTTPLNTYSWPAGRTEVGNNSDFHVADKVIGSLKDWSNAVMTRLWEIGGGEHWYSPTADHNVYLVRNGTTLFSNGDYFEWVGSNLHWRELRMVFANSTGYYNDIQDQLTNSPGLTDLADGQCIYVDLDRSQNRVAGTNALVAQKGTTATLGSPLVPGSRYIIAWRSGTNVYARGNPYAIGTLFNPATTTSLGMVELLQTSGTPATPVVFNPDANGALAFTATGGTYGLKVTTAVASSTALWGVATGASNGTGLFGQGGTGTGVGVSGSGGGNGPGVLGQGAGTGAGVVGTGGATNAPGVSGTGGATNGVGVQGTGAGTGAGGSFTGGATGSAVVLNAAGANTNIRALKTLDDVGNTRFLLDHQGYPTGGLTCFREDWGVSFSSITTNQSIAVAPRWSTIIGTGGSVVSSNNVPISTYPSSGIDLSATTAATAKAIVYTPANITHILYSNLSFAIEFDVMLSTSPQANQTYVVGLGFGIANGAPGIYLQAVGTGVWQLTCANPPNGPTTVPFASATPSTSPQTIRLEFFGSGSSFGVSQLRATIVNGPNAGQSVSTPTSFFGTAFGGGGYQVFAELVNTAGTTSSMTMTVGTIVAWWNRFASA